ncbi:hypothetical protein ET445_06835 [Agromyces protaetiae]|uniref:Uncharacterized protein n=1 Tax=Agromyces protaetiae TaxID=2509455 RepID=A0A4P6FBV2_9MICO|nr:DUF6412 domain-containing protein [Agromyces protaetiae]QAY73106.1 hypothetical protein ET445_06835 [Agromyces protaetiae]
MSEFVIALVRALQAYFELAGSTNASLSVMVVGVMGAAAVVVVVMTVRAMPGLVAADASGASSRLRQTADPGLLLSQSDPDAAGRARPRAPGRGLATA